MNHCDTCGEDFYSDTEYREHRVYEQLFATLQGGQDAAFTSQNRIAGSVSLMTIHQIMYREKVAWKDACETYLKRQQMFNSVIVEWNDHHA